MTSVPSYCHRGGKTPLLGITIPAHFASVVARYPDHDAVVSIPQQRRLNYAELAAQVEILVRGLLGSGFVRGDRIGVWSTNNIEWLLLQLATARIGAILVNINPAYRVRELAWALQRSEVNGLFLIPRFRGSDYVAMLLELVPQLATGPPDGWSSSDFPALRRVVLFDPHAPEQTETRHAGLLRWQDVLQAATPVTPAQLDAVTGSPGPGRQTR